MWWCGSPDLVCANAGSSNANSGNAPFPRKRFSPSRALLTTSAPIGGILVSEAGHQAGAVAAAKHTKITLTSLEELRDAAKDEILSLGLTELQRRSAHMKEFIFSLWTTERHQAGYSMSQVRPGVDGRLATQIGGAVSILATGVERAILGAFPVPLRFLEDGNTLVTAETLEDFVTLASQILDGLEEDIACCGNKPSRAHSIGITTRTAERL